MKTVEIDEKIEAINNEIKGTDSKLKQESSDMIDGQQARNPIQKELQAHFAELKIYTDKKRAIFANIEKYGNQIKDLSKQRDKLRMQVHPIYNDPEKLVKGIKELERRLCTESLDRQTEKNIVREIEQVKSSRPVFAQIEEINQKQTVKKELKVEAGVELPELNKVISKIKATIEKVKEKESVFVESKSDYTKKIDVHKSEKISKLGLIRLLRTEKNMQKEDFYARMIEYELQQLLLRDIDFI